MVPMERRDQRVRPVHRELQEQPDNKDKPAQRVQRVLALRDQRVQLVLLDNKDKSAQRDQPVLEQPARLELLVQLVQLGKRDQRE